MDDDRRDLGGLNPEPDGGAGWPGTEAGRRTRAQVEARLDAATLDPAPASSSRLRLALMIGAPALVVLLAVGLPLLLLRGGEPTLPVATQATTTTVPPTTTTVVLGLTEWVFQGTVLDKQGVGPQLCSLVLESLPPQCEGMPVIGLDWADIPWAESAGDTTWAFAQLVGYFDGQNFTLSRPPAEPEPVEWVEEDPFATPCPEPDGGWVVTDPELATQEAFEAARRYAEAQLAFRAIWIDYLVEPSEDIDLGPATFVLNVRFAESLGGGGQGGWGGDVVWPTDLAAHEAALREIYGGPLCVTLAAAQVTAAELRSIQEQVHLALDTPEAVAAGIYAGHGQTTGADELRGVVVATVFVVIDDARAQAWLDAHWGPGLVELHSVLVPLTFPVHLYVRNQSPSILLELEILIDGEVSTGGVSFPGDPGPLGQGDWELHFMDFAPGRYELTFLTREGGAELTETLEVQSALWAVVEFWADPAAGEARRFTWHIQDTPVVFP